MSKLATDPPVSEKQRRAMYAAASGHSTLGIPKKVGKEFVGKDWSLGRVMDCSGAWDLNNVLSCDAAEKLSQESVRYAEGKGRGYDRCGNCKHFEQPRMCELVTGPIDADGWCERFEVSSKQMEPLPLAADGKTAPEHKLTIEYDGDFNMRKFVQHLHRLGSIGASRTITAQDEDDDETPFGWDGDGADKIWKAVLDGQDILARKAMDVKPLAFDRALNGQTRHGLAFDRGSVRTYTVDGHLKIEVTPISKANVCPYLGSEIPDAELLGLDLKRVYKLLRDPAELAAGAETFNNLPLLRKHVAVSAKDHKFDEVIGSTGTDAAFVAPYLMNSLVVWTAADISGVETGKKRELSSAYRYRADMTPGVHDGAPYDGVMRDIVGNHVALVEEGRAGADVLVGDSIHPSLQEIFKMSKSRTLSRKVAFAEGALAVYLQPKLAEDAKINIGSVFKGVTSANFREKMGSVAEAVMNLTKGKLAQDAKLGDLPRILLAIDEAKVEEPKAEDDFEKKDDEEEDKEKAEDGSEDDEDMADDEDEEEKDAEKDAEEKLPNKDKKRARDKKARDKKAKDESAEKEREEEEAMDRKAKDKKAMDAAIAAAVTVATDSAIKGERKLQQAIYDARTAVRPYVGELPGMAFDSAAKVYQHAIKAASGKDVSAVKDEGALKTILELIPLPGSEHRSGSNVVAMDAAAAKSFAERFPGTQKIAIG